LQPGRSQIRTDQGDLFVSGDLRVHSSGQFPTSLIVKWRWVVDGSDDSWVAYTSNHALAPKLLGAADKKITARRREPGTHRKPDVCASHVARSLGFDALSAKCGPATSEPARAALPSKLSALQHCVPEEAVLKGE